MVGSDLEGKSYAASRDILEMMEANVSSNVNVILQTGGGSEETDELGVKRFIDFTNVQRHLVTGNNVTNLFEAGNVNMGEPDTLQNFITWSISNFPAKKYAIIFWDHGSGINGFGGDPLFNNDILTLDEIYQAFNSSKKLSGNNFELIGFDACLMASIEVANIVQPFGNYLVGSQEIESDSGWDYKSILQNLSSNSTQDGRAFGFTIANSYFNQSTLRNDSPIHSSDKDMTMSVIELKNIPKLISGINDIAFQLHNDLDNFSSVISLADSIDFSEQYGVSAQGTTGSIDLYDLLSNIKKKFPNEEKLITLTQDRLKNSIRYEISGDSKPNANGISIHLPQEGGMVNRSSITDKDFKSWRNMIDFQDQEISDNSYLPIVQTFFENNTIKGHINSTGIKSLTLQVIADLPEGKRYFTQQIDPVDVIDQNGSLHYVWNKKLLSLCDGEECTPAISKLESNGEKQFVLIPARLELDLGYINNQKIIDNVMTSLTYEADGNNEFTFLGAYPAIIGEGTIPKEKWDLSPSDKIHSMAYAFENDGSTRFINYDNSLNTTNNFGPRFVEYTGIFEISLETCDYSNNCMNTRNYHYENTIQQNHSSYKDKPIISQLDDTIQPDNRSIYLNSKFGFKMLYPAGWQLIESGIRDPIAVAFTNNNSDITKPAFLFEIIVEHWPYQSGAETSLIDYAEEVKATDPFFHINNFSSPMISGIPAYQLSYESFDGFTKINNLVIHVLYDDTMYVIYIRSSLDDFETYSQFLPTIINSFTIVDQTNTSTIKHEHDLNQTNGKSGKFVNEIGGSSHRNFTSSEFDTAFHGDQDSTRDGLNYSKFEEPNFGIKMLYPSNWRIETTDLVPDDYDLEVVQLHSPIPDVGYSADLSLTIALYDTDTAPVDLEEELVYRLDTYGLISSEFEVIEQNTNGTLSDLPAYVLVYNEVLDEIKIKVMEIGTIIDGNVYYVQYRAENDVFSNYLVEVGKILGSIEFSDKLMEK